MPNEVEVMNINDSGFSLDDDEQSKAKVPDKPIKEDRQITQEIASIARKKKRDPEEIEKHQEMVIMLSRYGQSKRFTEFLKSMGFNLSVTHLKKMEFAELEEVHQRVKTAINNKNVSNFWEELAFGLIQTGEIVCTKTALLGQRVKVQGITEMLKSDETFLDLIEQIELENQNVAYTSPYIRLVCAVVSSAMKCHGINSMLERRMAIIQQEMKSTEKPSDGEEVTIVEEETEEKKGSNSNVEEESENKIEKEEKEDQINCSNLSFA